MLTRAFMLPAERHHTPRRLLAAGLSLALALFGTAALALPASADDAPPPIAGDGTLPVVEPSEAPSPEASEPAPSPSPSEPAPAPAPEPAPSEPAADPSAPPTLEPSTPPTPGGGTAPMLAASGAPSLFAAAAPAAASPILGPTEITATLGAAIPAAEYTAPGLGTPRLRETGSVPWWLDDTRETWRGTLVVDGVARTAGTFTVQVYTGDSWRTRTASIDVTITVVSPATISGDDEPWGERGSYLREDYTLGGSPLPTASGVSFSTPLPAGLSSSVSGNRLRLEGTPTTPGRFSTTVTVTNTHGSASLPITFTIYGVDIAPVPDLDLARGVAMTPVLISVNAYPNPWLRLYGQVPNGLSVEAVTGGVRIYGTPTGSPSGTVTRTLTLEATNSWASDDEVFTIRVGNAPTIPALAPRTVRADEAMTPIQITATGATSLTAAAPLPAGLVLSGSGSSRTLSGTPSRTAMGEHTITFNATNDFGTTSATLPLTVQAKPAITVSDQTFTSGGDATHTVTATGWPLPQLSASGLPAGLTADGSTRGTLLVSGSTTALGSSTVQVTATNGVGPAVQATYQLSIVATPVFAQDTRDLTLRVGQAIDPAIEFDASSYPPHTIGLAPGSTLPDGLSLSANRLVGTPTAQSAGTHTVTVRATNTQGYDEQTLVITVLAPPDIASTSGSRTFQLDQENAFTLTTSGWLPPAVSVAGLPDGLALEQVDATTWRVSGTVSDPDELGTHTLRVTLTNSLTTVTRAMTVRVEGFAWLSGPSDIVVEAGAPMGFVVSSAAFPASAFITPTYPTGMGMTCRFTEWSYPTSTHPGTDNWLCDGTLHTVGPLTVVFRSDYDPARPAHSVHITVVERPVIEASDATVLAEADVSLPVTVTADPAPAPTAVAATGLPDGLSLEQDVDGSWGIVGSVAREDVGVYPVTITADNGLTGEHRLTLTVDATPVLPAGDVVLEIGEPFVGIVTADGSPTPTLEMTDGDLPDGMTWSATGATATLEGTPTEAGAWTYTVRATNGHGSVDQTYRVEVQQGAAFPQDAMSLTFVEGVAGSRELPLAGFPHPTVTVTGAVPGMRVEHTPGSAPVLTGTPADGSAGTHTLTLTAENAGASGTTQHTLTITVQVNAAPRFTGGTEPLEGTVGATLDRPLVIAGTPAVELTATGLPRGLALTQDTAGSWHLVGTPAPGTGGRHSVTITADNGVLAAASATVSIVVREPVSGVRVPAARLRVGTPAFVGVASSGGWPAPAALTVEGTLPNGLRFVDDGDGTGRVLGTPAAGTAGTWQVTVVGDNGVGAARATLTLVIAAAPAPTAPVTLATADDGTGVPPSPAADDGDEGDDNDDSGAAEGSGDEGAGDGSGDGDDIGAPPVLDPEETITVQGLARPWWWVIGSALLALLLLGARAVERWARKL